MKVESSKNGSPRGAAPLRLESELSVAMNLALSAGKLLRERRGPQLEIQQKSNGEIVTAADIDSNDLICRGLQTAFPADSICSEENPNMEPAPGQRVWIVDPLDSTSNYVQSGDEYSLSIGLAIAGEAVLGVVYNPSREELFSGHVGYGASWNGLPVRTSFAAPPHRPRVSVSSKEWKRGVISAQGCVITPMASMAYKLARVSAGREDGVVSLKNRKPWGTCAGTALVLAAGGRVTSLDGLPLCFDCRGPRTFPGLVASGPRLHAQVLELASSLKDSLQFGRSA